MRKTTSAELHQSSGANNYALMCKNAWDARNSLVIGEALGYRGGHFSGIPMTSERMLLRKQQNIVAGIKPRRTSKPSVCPNGFSEPTATIVWGALLKIGVLPDEFVLWNAFPWHSFDPHRGLLSNRMPNKSEQLSGRPVLKAFLELFPCQQIVALGKIAAAQLEQLGVECALRSPSGIRRRQTFSPANRRDRPLIVRQTTILVARSF